MDVTEDIIGFAENILSALRTLEGGKQTLAEIKTLTSEELEALYGVGYRLLACGKADDACSVFRLLCTLDHLTAKYWLALAAAETSRNCEGCAQIALAAVQTLQQRKQEEVDQ